MKRRKKNINPKCYRCLKDKEEGREKQAFCRECATMVMRQARTGIISMQVKLAESILDLLGIETIEYRKLNRILERKKENIQKKIKKENYDTTTSNWSSGV